MTLDTPHQTKAHSPSTQNQTHKKRALRDLNARYQPLRTAVNLIQANADRASRQLDEDYNRQRKAIINAREDDDWELRA